MLAYSGTLMPLNLRSITARTISPYQRNPRFGVGTFKGACGCSPTGGCGCGPNYGNQFAGLRLRQGSSEITAIENTATGWFNFLTGTTVTPPTTTGGLPSGSSLATSVAQYAPLIMVGLAIYLLAKR